MYPRQKWVLSLTISKGFIVGCKLDPNVCERLACTHFIQTHLCREYFSENISKTCSRRPKRFHPVCEKLPPKQSIWCRFLMVPFGSNSLLVRRSLPIK